MTEPGESIAAEEALERACMAAGIDPRDATALHGRANTVHLVPHVGAVVRLRLIYRSREWERRLRASIQLTRWLADCGFPAVRPLPINQPVLVDGWAVTFWHYEPVEPNTATVTDLAHMLRWLHALPAPPIDLPENDPLGSLPADVEHDELLPAETRDWLRAQCAEIRLQYRNLAVPLDLGLIHGDAHVGNLLRVNDRCLFADWDSTSYGHRVQDLIPTLHRVRHFGHPRTDWHDLCAAYGIDSGIEHHPGVQLLQRARELRALAAYIRSATRPEVRHELHKRVRTLMTGEFEQWSLV